MKQAFRLLARLESIEMDPENVDLALSERAKHLEALTALDMTSLGEVDRKEVRARLQRLLQTDADMILEARAEMREIDKGRKNAARGRAAARGYRAANPRIQPALEQDA